MVDTREIALRRMYAHRLWGARIETPEAVVGSFAAMQAQELVPAKWSVAQRTTAATESAMDKALADGAILRTHVVRPTWHFVRRDDVRWLLDLTGPRVNQLNAYYYRKFGLDDDAFARCHALLRKTLRGERQLTRKELSGALEKAGVKAGGLQLGYLLMRAELDAVLISGAPRGRQQTYALFDERVPDATTLDHDAALAELTKRYFAMRGPATVKDFTRWSSLTMADAKNGLSMAKSELDQLVAGGRTYWSMPAASPPPVTSVVDLIQGYDEYVMSYSESKDVLFRTGEPGGGGDPGYLHAVLLNGQLVGHWKHMSRSRSVLVQTALYRGLTADETTALGSAVASFGRFMEVPATWQSIASSGPSPEPEVS